MNDVQLFESERRNLLASSPGKFVVYANGERVGVYETKEAAAYAAIVERRLSSFVLREIRRQDPVYALPTVLRVG